ncbi:hypothetical protein Q5P01_000239 [Channa striata]|uniref:Uncharacterized protein n=1 Tax=Channa striata TaxID=64152 RepID=A0AA88LN21_CHASR|nr:hypothetical protein Q5P01_000239 [Channa striata]
MSRTYCVNCGSSRTLDPLGDFISHSFSVSELQFLFQNVLPDLSGRVLGAVLYGGCVYSSASQLISVDLSEAFVQMQNNVLLRFRLNDRVQDVLLQNADVLIMNNVFEFFMKPSEQLSSVQVLQPGWVEALPLDYDVYLGRDTGSLRQIHLYRVM